MDGFDAVLTRRSIRKYEKRPVDEGIVREVLRAAMNAPSAGNEQPWYFIVVRDRGLLDAVPSVHPYAGMLRGASLAIIVCGDPALEKYKDYWVQDCSAATENILVAANALGLGSVWLGVYPLEDRIRGLRRLFGIPEHVIPFSIVPLGYPAEHKPPAERYDETRVRRERW